MRYDLLGDLKGLNGSIRGQLASIGGATSPEMTQMGRILRRSVAKVLSVSGGGAIAGQGPDRGGHRSRPGEPPRAQTFALAKSVKAGVVGTGIRVGPLRFTADFLQSGVDASLGDRKTFRRHGLKRASAGLKKRTLRSAARPYLEKALDNVKDQLATEFAGVAGARIGSA